MNPAEVGIRSPERFASRPRAGFFVRPNRASTFAKDRDAWERAYLASALGRYGTVLRAAQHLGLNRTDLHRRMARLGIPSPRPCRRGRWE